jgi:hypothetical protein
MMLKFDILWKKTEDFFTGVFKGKETPFKYTQWIFVTLKTYYRCT